MLLMQLTPLFIVMFVLAVIFSAPVVQKLRSSMRSEKLRAAGEPVSYGISLIMLAICVLTLASASYNPFIYFRF
jgi:alginate O-acetyltransferase complex protein AlgI